MEPVVPLRFEDGALLILDQRRLPADEQWLRCQAPDEVAEAIRTMAVRGAPAIGLAAAYGLALGYTDPAAAAALLERARPTAANLAWAVRRSLDALDPSDPQGSLLGAARSLERDQHEADRRLAALGAARARVGERVLTHCNTGALATGGYGTAGGVLSALHEQGKLELVWVDETRPLLQGARLTAWELERQGIPYRLVCDGGAGALFERGLVDRVAVGADRIAANGDVANKIGTYPLAVLAHRHGVPFDVVAPLSTFDPNTPSGASIAIEERSPDEIRRVGDRELAPAGADAFNPAFDVTPAELVSALVCEAGVLEAPFTESIAGAVGR